MGVTKPLTVEGGKSVKIYQAKLPTDGDEGACALQTSPAQRHSCSACASALWISGPRWPESVYPYPFASAMDTPLPEPRERVHIMLNAKPDRVEVAAGPADRLFEEYPEDGIADWHRKHGL